MTDWDPEAWTRNLIADMRANGGRPSSGPMAGKTLMILTSKGAKSGEPRTAIVTYHRDGDRLVIAASKSGAPTHPAWYHNVVANPDVTVEVDNEVFPGHVREITGAERDRLWNDHVRELPEFGEYPKITDRVIPILVVEKAGQAEQVA
ncbi:MAG TPA: nitroreductase family deazaflavin-dependent oxidoreductase [Candidatus Limnocylindrales bacterium]|jgi:deazaflavin-dependent oxidoreductase (nitroreductase family)|nr:nitroreductase family deazaflavin-dependent oxidoreductase [Candidatus Limnocylindrales bacterium]